MCTPAQGYYKTWSILLPIYTAPMPVEVARKYCSSFLLCCNYICKLHFLNLCVTLH